MISFKHYYSFALFFISLLSFSFNNKDSPKKKGSKLIIQPEILHKLYEINEKEDNIFSSMTEAIKYSLNSLKADLKSYPSNECRDTLCLEYQNAYAREIICQSLDNKNTQYIQSDERFAIILTNCTFFINNIAFLSEIYFDKIYFYQNKINTKGELNIEFEYDKAYN